MGDVKRENLTFVVSLRPSRASATNHHSHNSPKTKVWQIFYLNYFSLFIAHRVFILRREGIYQCNLQAWVQSKGSRKKSSARPSSMFVKSATHPSSCLMQHNRSSSSDHTRANTTQKIHIKCLSHFITFIFILCGIKTERRATNDEPTQTDFQSARTTQVRCRRSWRISTSSTR